MDKFMYTKIRLQDWISKTEKLNIWLEKYPDSHIRHIDSSNLDSIFLRLSRRQRWAFVTFQKALETLAPEEAEKFTEENSSQIFHITSHIEAVEQIVSTKSKAVESLLNRTHQEMSLISAYKNPVRTNLDQKIQFKA